MNKTLFPVAVLTLSVFAINAGIAQTNKATMKAIVSGMRTIWETMKIIIEPSAAVPYAAIVESKIDIAGKRVGIILTGGNVDLDALPWK